jgi:hypothetical protein
MSVARSRRGAGWAALLLVCALAAGCGAGTTATAVRPSDPATAEARAVAFAHAVNLRAGDLAGYFGSGAETQEPKPGRYDLEYHGCLRAGGPARGTAAISSPELAAGRAFDSRLVISRVEVWPTAGLVALHEARSHGARGRACLVAFLDATHAQTNRERAGRGQIGPFTIKFVSYPLPGVTSSFLTRIDETRLRRNGSVLLQIYRDLYGFATGRAEVELEAIGFSHPVPAVTEKAALARLLARARANAGKLPR